jgi:hypothetical protein
MKYFYGAFLLVAITATSCKNDETAKNQGDPRLVVPFTQQTAIANSSSSVSTATSGNHNLFHENNTGTTPSVAAGINPAHGQPNHRCDIAVGAPLNTPVNGSAQAQTTNAQPTQMVTTTQTGGVKTITPKGINPPHGEKNHRCDIAVGAPINSKVAAAVSQNSGQVSQKIDVQPAIPSLLATSSADTETPEGMNPAHGKEGHRCDIAVGAPLPKS